MKGLCLSIIKYSLLDVLKYLDVNKSQSSGSYLEVLWNTSF